MTKDKAAMTETEYSSGVGAGRMGCRATVAGVIHLHGCYPDGEGLAPYWVMAENGPPGNLPQKGSGQETEEKQRLSMGNVCGT